MDLVLGDEEDVLNGSAIRIPNASTADVARVFSDSEQIHYGQHYRLLADGTDELQVICTSGPFAAPHEPGDFLIYIGDRLVGERLSRREVRERLSSAILGDLRWAE